jgi:CcmD family protein
MKTSNSWLGALAIAGLVALSVPSVSSAQDQPEQGEQAEDPAESRSTAFRAMEGADTEHVPGGTLVIAAYAFIWLLMMGYVFRLSRISAATARDVERLEKSLDTEKKGSGES